MIYEPRICDICEEWGCKADEYRQTMQLSTEAVGPEHKAFWPAMRCAFKASNLKATYKARAEAAEGKVERVRELAIAYAIHTNRKDGNYGHGIKNVLHVVANKLLEALNG